MLQGEDTSFTYYCLWRNKVVEKNNFFYFKLSKMFFPFRHLLILATLLALWQAADANFHVRVSFHN